MPGFVGNCRFHGCAAAGADCNDRCFLVGVGKYAFHPHDLRLGRPLALHPSRARDLHGANLCILNRHPVCERDFQQCRAPQQPGAAGSEAPCGHSLLPPRASDVAGSSAGLAGSAIVNSNRGALGLALADIAGVLLAAALFLAVFAWRMSREYRGENLSEASARPVETIKSEAHAAAPFSVPEVEAAELQSASPASSLLSPVLLATLQKEWIYVRRNPTQFYGLVAPLAMVFILAGRLGSLSRTGLVFPVGAAYSILGVAALAYNLLGIDAAGVQFYFLAPVSLRSVILAKNLFGFCINLLQIVLLYTVIAFTTGVPGLWVTLSTLAWLLLAVLVNATVGNMRSLTAPKKVDPSKLSRKQASQLSALLSLGLMLAVGAVGGGLIVISRLTGLPWLPVPILLAFAAGAFALYLAGLNRVEALALNHRETLIEELSKISV